MSQGTKEEASGLRLQVVDSHTAGEPTRVVVAGGPEAPVAGAAAARDYLRQEADWMRCALIHEPRGFEAVVGAYLCEPTDESCVSGVVFFNNTGYLNGCLHGTIGVMETLRHLGRIEAGVHRLETPIGVVTAEIAADGRVTVSNVPSYRYLENVAVMVPEYGEVVGDVAWGGNWFFLIEGQGPPVRQSAIEELTRFTWAVRQALDASALRGEDGGLIDHVELFATPAPGVAADSQNFVLCPGKAYDRSPCGTGTSAKLACLAASGKLAEGEVFRQAGILGTCFEGRYQRLDARTITPIVTGQAFVTAETNFIMRTDDPYRFGVEFPQGLDTKR
ncbi:proline racemase family protein [Roseibacillus ishigakijimensis]|uniref:Proline racemase family protein n=1 Tax=Roseibacillus ishigakijimensis TaxID=454146 RepID=A0A934RK19_9BACT|nr:proline racemase family protein [Roseibacillus ishigakijimensis]MBK1833137.1 proline racemase family protein [Roseibacillus ishigakijimensis]